MSLDQYSKEELQEMSFIEVAFKLLEGKKQAVSFNDLVAEIEKTLGLNEAEATERMIQFYTDLNIDGRFLNLGENRWGLRVWYPVDQAEEDVITPVKPRKKKAKKKAVEDDFDDIEDLEEEEVFEDEFDDDLEDDDLLDDDFEEEEEEEEEFDDDLIDDEEEEDLDIDEEDLDEEEEADDEEEQ
ncbi:DNA-directed RNA polymerase subunit delta [Bacillus sp. B15-48]|nr:DNA-directed RNA polymerase subunit delta [Bacillus sp. B15-48]MBM4761562.1 DNA-directed RNA polymerase subunit delta [Bacillus sp. B15-48]